MARRLFILFLLFALSFSGKSQRSFFSPSDTLHKGRLIGTSVGIGGVWAGSMLALSELWYKNNEKSALHSFDDSKNWLQMDKLGHFYAAYKINALSSELFEWSGVPKKKAIWIGTGISLGYQTTFELFDGHSKKWGFSWSDLLANIAGTASYTVQQLLWQKEYFIPKFSFFPTEFAPYRPEVLGSSFASSLMKDYNGQTYWLSFSLGTFIKSKKFPEWLCFSFGYSVSEKLVGNKEFYQDPISGREFHSKRQFLFSLDIDFSKIPAKKPWVRALLKQLNYLKIPFPALILSNGKLSGHGFYF